MINLLPPQQKQKILQDEKYRLVLILGAVFLLFLICLSLVLLSLKIHIGAQVAPQEIIENPQTQQFETKISLANKNLSKINTFYKNQPNLTKVLEMVSVALPQNVNLTVFSLNPVAKEENKFQVSLIGTSIDRETLFEFKKNLEEESVFEDVYFPPASWVDPTNFTVTFKISI